MWRRVELLWNTRQALVSYAVAGTITAMPVAQVAFASDRAV
jgi:hypothetical protein